MAGTAHQTELIKAINLIERPRYARDTGRDGADEGVLALLRAGADPNERNKLGRTSMHYAVNPGVFQTATLKALVDAGGDVNAVDKNGNVPMHGAVIQLYEGFGSFDLHSSQQVVLNLLSLGAEPDAANHVGCTPLHVATGDWCEGAAALLIKAGANVNAVTQRGETPLLSAVGGGMMEFTCDRLVRLLVEAGADVSVVDESSRNTPLHYCARRGAPGEIDILAAAGAGLEPRNKEGRTPLLEAALSAADGSNMTSRNVSNAGYRRRYAGSVERLVRWESRVDAIDPRGNGALHYLAKFGDPHLIKLVFDPL